MRSEREPVSLSVFSWEGRGWVWKRLEPGSGSEVELAVLGGTKSDVPHEFAISPDGHEAMVVTGDGAEARLIRVTSADGSPRSLPEVRHDAVLTGGYSSTGAPLALYADRWSLTSGEDENGHYWLLDGERYPFDPRVEDGGQWRNVVASVYRLDEGNWALVERHIIKQVARNDTRQLAVQPSLPGNDMDLLNGGRPFIANSCAATSDPWIRKWGQANEYLEWYRNDRGARSICFRAYRESPGLAPEFVVESEKGWVAREAGSKYDFMRGDLRGQVRGEYVWVTNRRDQGRLHDLRTGRVVWEAPPACRASIWPGPAAR